MLSPGCPGVCLYVNDPCYLFFGSMEGGMFSASNRKRLNSDSFFLSDDASSHLELFYT